MNKNSSDNSSKSNIQWYPGHMAKTSRLLKEVLGVIDMAIIVVDARCPFASFSPMIEEILKNKQILICFSKIDLADEVQTNKWVKYYQDLGYSVCCVNLLGKDVTDKISSYADKLLESVFEKEAKKGMKRRKMRLVIAGVPNAGKSTLINKFTKKKVVNVGDRAGITKNLQWIRVNDKYELLDSPGLLWPKFEVVHVGFSLAVTKGIKSEILPVDEVCIFILDYLHKFYPSILEKMYGITMVDDIVECYEKIGRRLGLLKKGGVVDYEMVSLRVLNDAHANRFGKITWDNYELLREFL